MGGLKNYRLFFIAAVVCAILAALVGAYGYSNMAKMVTVAVASRDITADEQVNESNVLPGKQPAGSLMPDSVGSVEEIKGMMAKGFIPAGTPLRQSMFVPIAGAGYAAKLGAMEDDKVALAITDSVETSVGKALKKGDRVTVKSTNRAGDKETLAPEAIVLDVPDRNNNNSINAVILAVTQEEADKIATSKPQGLTVWCELLPVNGGGN